MKEFAELAGVTQQAVYQRLNKSLTSFVVEMNGKKYLKIEALDAIGKAESNQDSRQIEQGFNNVEQGFNKVEGIIETLQITVETLREQLKTKDQQINELNKRLEQALNNMSQSHFIAAQAQKRLSDETAPTEEERPAENAQDPSPTKKKRFFERIFSNK